MNRVEEAWKKIGGDPAAVRRAIKDGSSKIILAEQAIPGNTTMPEKIEVNAKRFKNAKHSVLYFLWKVILE
jgi:hypothetical protein